MMRIITRLLMLLIFILGFNELKAQATLEIQVLNLRSNNGSVALELVDKNDEIVKEINSEIVNQVCIIIVNELKDGQYAIRYFHDENSNAELDTNWIGIPKEGYGFSNDAYGNFGPKDFTEWLFNVSGDTKISLTTTY